jgi:hypothetical protein
MVAVEEAQGALDADGYGFPGLFGVVAQPPGSPAAAEGTGEFRDKRVSFGPGAGGALGVVVGVGLGDVVIKVAQPGPVGGQRLPV